MACTIRTELFPPTKASWLLPPGAAKLACPLLTLTVPPAGATTAHKLVFNALPLKSSETGGPDCALRAPVQSCVNAAKAKKTLTKKNERLALERGIEQAGNMRFLPNAVSLIGSRDKRTASYFPEQDSVNSAYGVAKDNATAQQ